MTQSYDMIKDPRHSYLQPYTALNPHPRAQTIYHYPLGSISVIGSFTILNTTWLACVYFELYTTIAGVLGTLVTISWAVLFLAHPSVVPRRRVVIKTANDKELEIWVYRPVFGRRCCEVKVGINGELPFEVCVSLWTGREYRMRQESALWLVGW